MKSDFLIDETLENGRYRIRRHLMGKAGLRLYLADEAAVPEQQYLVSVIHNAHDLPIDAIERELRHRPPGSFELVHIGRFDGLAIEAAGRDPFVDVHWGMVEKISSGRWLPDLSSDELSRSGAVHLALSVGDLLVAASRCGVFHVSLRPESIWVTVQGQQLTATAITTRFATFFKHRRAGVGHIFERGYNALEVSRGSPQGSATLTFPLATMLAEWSTGKRPFPPIWHGLPAAKLGDLAHELIEVPRALQQLLHRGLAEQVAQRIPLEPFLAELRAISVAERA